MVTLPEQSSRLFLRRRNLAAGLRLQHDRIYGVCVGLLDTEHFPLGGRNRQQDDVVLIVSLGRLALSNEHPDHSEWDIFNTDRLADRIGSIKQVIHRSLAEYGDFGSAIYILLSKLSPGSNGEIANRQIVGSNAINTCCPVTVSVNDLGCASHHGCCQLHVRT